jgi:hypothetical protein
MFACRESDHAGLQCRVSPDRSRQPDARLATGAPTRATESMVWASGACHLGEAYDLVRRQRVCGEELVRLGAVLFVVTFGLRFVQGLPELGYVVICLALFVVGSLRATVCGIRVARRLSKGGVRSTNAGAA